MKTMLVLKEYTISCTGDKKKNPSKSKVYAMMRISINLWLSDPMVISFCSTLVVLDIK